MSNTNCCSYCFLDRPLSANSHNVAECSNPNLKKCFVDIVEIFHIVNEKKDEHNMRKFCHIISRKYNYVTIEAVSLRYGNTYEYELGQTKLSYMKKLYSDFVAFSEFMEKIELFDTNINPNIELRFNEQLVNGDFSCPICYTSDISGDDKVLFNCLHEFCGECAKKLINSSPQNPCCAYCRTKIETITVKNVNCTAWSKLCLVI